MIYIFVFPLKARTLRRKSPSREALAIEPKPLQSPQWCAHTRVSKEDEKASEIAAFHASNWRSRNIVKFCGEFYSDNSLFYNNMYTREHKCLNTRSCTRIGTHSACVILLDIHTRYHSYSARLLYFKNTLRTLIYFKNTLK